MFSLLVQTLIGSTAILAFALLAALVLRRQSAAMRHALLCSVMIALIVLPLAIPFLPTFAPVAKNILPEPTPKPPVVETVRAEPVATMPQFAPMPVSMSEQLPQMTLTPVIQNEVIEQNAEIAQSKIPWGTLVLVTLCSVAIVRLIILVTSLFAAQKLARRATPFQPLAPATLDEVRKRFRVRRDVRVLTDPRVEVPFAANLFRPIVFLPESMRHTGGDRLRLVLMHEMAHIARHDVFWQLLTRVLLAIYWFHPLAWLLAARIRREREFACDDAVLCERENPEDYATVLLDISESIRRRPVSLPGCTVAMAQTPQIEQRIRAILDLHRARQPLSRLTGLLLIFIACTMTAFAGMFSPFEQEQKPSEPEKKLEAPVMPPQEMSEHFATVVASPTPSTADVPRELDVPQIQYKIIVAEIGKKSSSREISGLIAEHLKNQTDNAYGVPLATSEESLNALFESLVEKGKITVVSRPVMMAMDQQYAAMIVGSKEKNTTVEIVPRLQGRQILSNITLKKDVDDADLKMNGKTFQCSTLATLQENVPLFVSGLTMKSDDGESGNEIMLCVTATIIPPKEKEKEKEPPRRNISFQGHVFMPDGTPAKNAVVHYSLFTLLNKGSALSGNMYSSGDKPIFHIIDGSIQTDEQGKYTTKPMQFTEGLPNVIWYAELLSENGEPLPYVSESTVFDNPDDDLQEHDFTLIKAAPVTGTVRYPDGSPARIFAVVFKQTLKTDGSQSLIHARVAVTNADGQFTIYLPSGDYRYFARSNLNDSLVVLNGKGEPSPPPNASEPQTIVIDANKPTELGEIVLRNPREEETDEPIPPDWNHGESYFGPKTKY